MAEDGGKRYVEITVATVQVGLADAARHDLDQKLVGPGFGEVDGIDGEWSEFVGNDAKWLFKPWHLYQMRSGQVVGERFRYYQGTEDALIMTVEPLDQRYWKVLRSHQKRLLARLAIVPST